MKDIEYLVKGLFLILLLISGNYLNSCFSCQIQNLLENNMYIKHLIIILSIFFTLDFTNNQNTKNLNLFIKSIFVWIVFILFSKMNIEFTILVLLLFTIQYLLYKKSKKENNLIQKKKYSKYQSIFLYLTLIIILIGFTIYYLEKKKKNINLGQILNLY